jgi:hypothetical protein
MLVARRRILLPLLIGLLGAGLAGALAARGQAPPPKTITFRMVRSSGVAAAKCLPNAQANVTDTSLGPVERLTVAVSGLPANTDFDLFVIQVPNAPFGLSWYQGDIVTGASGARTQNFVGRFNRETFIVAPGVAPAPVVHPRAAFPDASSNPATAPVHTFHLGLWFNSPADAAKAGCGNTVTPFNGTHNAGVQALSTRNFGLRTGPLRSLAP